MTYSAGNPPDIVVRILVTIVVTVAFSLVAWFRLWPQWLRRIRSGNWASAIGRIEGGDVSVMRDGRREIVTCTLKYSYQVAGQYFGGNYSRQFGDEQAAYDYVDTRKGSQVEVRYDPRKPGSSVLM